MMSSQTVPDRVNKYRYGVLIGNFAEEAFGQDHANKEFAHKPLPITTMKGKHALENSLHQFHPIIAAQPQQTDNLYKLSEHVEREGFIQPETQSTYNIFYRKQVQNRVPIVENNPKKEERHQREQRLFEVTKSKLADTNLRWPHSANSVIVNDPAGVTINALPNGTAGATSSISHPDAVLNLGMALTGAVAGHIPKDSGADQSSAQVANILKSTGRIPQVRAKSVNPYSTHTLVRPQVKKLEDVEYTKLVLPHEGGEQRDILFGHGLEIDQFHGREFGTTYDLSYNQSIKPQTQINSFFKPDLTKTAKQFHSGIAYEKNHQPQIPQFANRNELYNDKICRPYAPYTKTYDHNHNRTQYLRK